MRIDNIIAKHRGLDNELNNQNGQMLKVLQNPYLAPRPHRRDSYCVAMFRLPQGVEGMMIYDANSEERNRRYEWFLAQQKAEEARRDLATAGILPEYCWDHVGDDLGGWMCKHPDHKVVQG